MVWLVNARDIINFAHREYTVGRDERGLPITPGYSSVNIRLTRSQIEADKTHDQRFSIPHCPTMVSAVTMAAWANINHQDASR